MRGEALGPGMLGVLGFLGMLMGCGDDVLQGDVYRPDGRLPIDPPSSRDAGDDAAGPSRSPVPSRDGGLDGGVFTPPSNTCETARVIGEVPGDDGALNASTTGTCAEYLRVDVKEVSSSAIGEPMAVRITLSPSSHDFDLYAFFDPTSPALACSSLPFARSETNGTAPETIDLTWGEGTVSNGADDGRPLVVAVTSASGPCLAGATWSLTVRGNP